MRFSEKSRVTTPNSHDIQTASSVSQIGGAPSTQVESILAAAYECLSEKGYAEVSLREIAQKASVALSQLHYYFKSKRGLFIAVIRNVTQRYVNEIREQLEDTEPNQLLSQVAELFHQKIDTDPGWLRLWFDLTNMGMWDHGVRPHMQELFREVNTVLEEKVFNRLSPDEAIEAKKTLSRIFLGTVFGVSVQALVDSEKLDAAEALRSIPSFFKGAINSQI